MLSTIPWQRVSRLPGQGWLLFSLVILVALGCRRREQVSLLVVDETTNKPMRGATIEHLVRKKVREGRSGGGRGPSTMPLFRYLPETRVTTAGNDPVTIRLLRHDDVLTISRDDYFDTVVRQVGDGFLLVINPNGSRVEKEAVVDDGGVLRVPLRRRRY